MKMERPGVFRVLRRYLCQHCRSLGLTAAFAVIFAVIFALYRLPLEAVLYAYACCAAAGAAAVAFDFVQYYRRHCRMALLQKTIALGADQLPEPRNLTEEDYTALLRQLDQERLRVVAQGERAAADMVGYYTLWAHQIKTPIAAMRLLLQPEESEQIRELSAELFRVEQYVEMVLSYLRLQSDSTDYVIRACDLDAIVRQSVRKYAGQFIRKKLTLTMGELHCRVLTDEKWLGFVIEQLLSNAIKYTGRGGVTITLEEGRTLCIADTGIGIAQEDLPRLGEKGFTGCNGRADRRATGIGLYLCRQVLGRLSHSMEITSKVGEGTCVRLRLDSVELERE